MTNGKLLLIGRAEMVSRSQAISTSYSCNDPCPPFLAGSLDPFLPPVVFVSHSGNSSAWMTAYYDNGYVSGPYTVGAEWTPDSSSITVDPSGAHTTTATGALPGSVCVTADMGQEESYSWDGLNCYDNYHTYTIGDNTCTEVADVHIKQGSNNITGTTQNAIVGQQISLSVEVVGTTEAVSNIQWAVPGNRIANYAASLSSGTVTSLNNLQASSLTFYWIDGGDNRQVTLGCRIGTTQFDKSATFNIKRPTASVTTSTGTPNVFTPTEGNLAGMLALEYGQPSPGTPGIKFTESHTIPQGFSGELEWIQLVDTTRTRTTNANVVQTLQGSGGDNVYPYPFITTHTTEDSPGTPLTTDYKAFTISDSSTMYLMFRPTGTTGTPIWVPLRKIDWSWGASATRSGSGNTWTLNSSSHTSNPADVDSTDCPTWTGSVGSLQFH